MQSQAKEVTFSQRRLVFAKLGPDLFVVPGGTRPIKAREEFEAGGIGAADYANDVEVPFQSITPETMVVTISLR